MEFKSELLVTKEQNLGLQSSIKGSYNTMQFVVRLSDSIRKELDEKVEMSSEKLQAFSTYLHENIHWWQHIGSNFGFLFSTSYPTYIIGSYSSLKKLVSKKILFKSILKYEEKLIKERGYCGISELNIIVNNFHDIENAKKFASDNKNIKSIINDRRLFLSLGHSYFMFWSSVIFSLSDLFDQNHKFIPDHNLWIRRFKELEDLKIEGFYADSNYKISPLGIRAIYEGQASFNQLLYLANVFKKNKPIFKDFIDVGMLHGIYLEAFNLFLKILDEKQPFFLDDPLIPLFLLVCDISINPNNGFPLDIYDFENFINKNDPGLRFISICDVISKKKDFFLKKCEDLNKETYTDLSKYINKNIGCKCSYNSISEIVKWFEEESIKDLLNEEEAHDYKDTNMPIRLLFAKYLRFQKDKYENPHIFCWIGHHIPNATSDNVMNLFEKHKALFMDAEDGEIKASIIDNLDDEKVYETFNKFYQHTILYELILNWITEEGPFKIDYQWLYNSRNDANIEIIKELFKSQFGINLEEITII